MGIAAVTPWLHLGAVDDVIGDGRLELVRLQHPDLQPGVACAARTPEVIRAIRCTGGAFGRNPRRFGPCRWITAHALPRGRRHITIIALTVPLGERGAGRVEHQGGDREPLLNVVPNVLEHVL